MAAVQNRYCNLAYDASICYFAVGGFDQSLQAVCCRRCKFLELRLHVLELRLSGVVWLVFNHLHLVGWRSFVNQSPKAPQAMSASRQAQQMEKIVDDFHRSLGKMPQSWLRVREREILNIIDLNLAFSESYQGLCAT